MKLRIISFILLSFFFRAALLWDSFPFFFFLPEVFRFRFRFGFEISDLFEISSFLLTRCIFLNMS